MKKLLLIIGALASIVSVNAEITTTIDGTWLNYQYLTTDGDITAGADNIFYLNLKQDGAARDLQGIITFPEGYVVKKMTAVKTNWVIDEDIEEYVLKLNRPTIYDNPRTVKYVISSSSAECCYTAPDMKVAKFTVTVPANAAAVCNVSTTDSKVAVTSEYQTAHNYPYNYEFHEVNMVFNVVGSTGVAAVKSENIKPSVPMKRVENGQLVIDTLDGTYTTSGVRIR